MQPNNNSSTNEALLSIALAIQTSFGKAEAQQAFLAADQSTTSTSYTDLATAGPAVSADINKSGRALVILIGGIYTTATPKHMSVAVSGATTVAASDTEALRADQAAFYNNQATAFIMTGLTPGANTFTCKYKTASGTANFFNRRIIVIPL